MEAGCVELTFASFSLATLVDEAVGIVRDGAERIGLILKVHDDGGLQMPVVDGLTATRMIRALDHPAAEVPIVAMSANVLPHQVALCREAGMQDNVGKPFERADLLAAIERWGSRANDPSRAEDALGHVDRESFDQVAGPMGVAATRRLLDSFARELRVRFDGDVDVGDLAAHAHAVISAASMLGFTAFAGLCRDAQMARGEDVARLSARLRSGSRRVLSTLETLAAAA